MQTLSIPRDVLGLRPLVLGMGSLFYLLATCPNAIHRAS